MISPGPLQIIDSRHTSVSPSGTRRPGELRKTAVSVTADPRSQDGAHPYWQLVAFSRTAQLCSMTALRKKNSIPNKKKYWQIARLDGEPGLGRHVYRREL